jgi:hypothetical protein
MFMRLPLVKVIRFGKLFCFRISKSCPFWKTRIGCKGSNFPENFLSFISKKNIK